MDLMDLTTTTNTTYNLSYNTAMFTENLIHKMNSQLDMPISNPPFQKLTITINTIIKTVPVMKLIGKDQIITLIYILKNIKP